MNLSDADNEEDDTEESAMPKIRDDRTLLSFVGVSKRSIKVLSK